MIFALGFLIASLMALAIAPAFWQRAIRLSTRRLEMQLPLSQAEILAGRDLLRAEFAVEQRRLEQKAEALNRLHAADLAELGRNVTVMARQEADLRAFSQRSADLEEEIAGLRRTLAETSAELAAAAKDDYDMSGLLGRKDLRIQELTASLKEAQTLAARQREEIETLEANAAQQKNELAAITAKAATLESELSTLQLQYQADQVTLKTAATRIADREEALEAAAKREKELIRLRTLQAETSRAMEAGHHEKIERLRSVHAETQAALEAASRTCEQLKEELAALRAAAPHDAETLLLYREENEILRQKIKEIGAAVIRAAGSPGETSPGEASPGEGLGDGSNEPRDTSGQVSQKATA